jgi:hypothetical protein
MVIANDGTVIALGRNRRIQRFTAEGGPICTWQLAAAGILAPYGPDELLVIERRRAVRYSLNGDLVAEIPMPGMDDPNDVVAAADGSFYVLSKGMVWHVAADGSLLGTWGTSECEWDFTTGGTGKKALSSAPTGCILVWLMTGPERVRRVGVHVVGQGGELKATIPITEGLELPEQYPNLLLPITAAAGPGDSVWVIAGEHDFRDSSHPIVSYVVARRDYDGSLLTQFPLVPIGEVPFGKVRLPKLATAESGTLDVLDRQRRRVLRYGLEGQLLAEWELPNAFDKFMAYEFVDFDAGADGSIVVLQDWGRDAHTGEPPPPRITRFDAAGRTLASWIIDEQHQLGYELNGLAVSAGRDGTVFAAVDYRVSPVDAPERIVLVYSSEGQTLGTLSGSSGWPRLMPDNMNGRLFPDALEATADGRLLLASDPYTLRVFGPNAENAWRAVFYATRYMDGLPAAALAVPSPGIDLDWGDGAPSGNLPADGFAARFRRVLDLPAGTYRFHVEALGGARLWVGTRLLLDRWGAAAVDVTSTVFLSGGESAIQLDFTDPAAAAKVHFDWDLVQAAPAPVLIPYGAR